MPSPFPGMDPYIAPSGLWEDFHAKLIGEIEAAAAEAAPPQYRVRIGERTYVVLARSQDLEPTRHAMQADVGVTQPTLAAVAVAEPQTQSKVIAVADGEEAVILRALIEVEFRETFVEITSPSPEQKLITTIEVLSPSNNRSESLGWRQYMRKRQAHFEGRANFVEIDLLRSGKRMPMEDDWPQSPYYVLTSWERTAPVCKVWPAYFDRPLPALRIPLAPPDDDLVIKLQPMIDAIYERSRYARDIDYHQPCQPALDQQSANWLAERLK